MKKFTIVSVLASLFIFPALSFAGWATLSQNQEVDVVVANPNGGGTAFLKLNAEETELEFKLVVSGLSAAITGSHFHGPAAPGANAGVVKGFTMTGNVVTGVWRTTDATQPLTPALVQAYKDGMLYLNVHTSNNPGGEIRGQVHPEDVLVAELNAAQEVPAPTGVPATAYGIGIVALNANQTEAQLSLTVTDLSGPITAGHIHSPAAPGATASPAKGLTFTGNHTTTVWSASDASQALTATRLSELLGGMSYYNVHTTANGGGEIRGQILSQTQTTSNAVNWEIMK